MLRSSKHLTTLLAGILALSQLSDSAVYQNALTTSPICQDGYLAGTDCEVQCDVEYLTVGYKSIKASRMEDCIKMCDSDSNCKVVSYRAESSVCSLMSSVLSSRKVADIDSAICGARRRRTTFLIKKWESPPNSTPCKTKTTKKAPATTPASTPCKTATSKKNTFTTKLSTYHSVTYTTKKSSSITKSVVSSKPTWSKPTSSKTSSSNTRFSTTPSTTKTSSQTTTITTTSLIVTSASITTTTSSSTLISIPSTPGTPVTISTILPTISTLSLSLPSTTTSSAASATTTTTSSATSTTTTTTTTTSEAITPITTTTTTTTTTPIITTTASTTTASTTTASTTTASTTTASTTTASTTTASTTTASTTTSTTTSSMVPPPPACLTDGNTCTAATQNLCCSGLCSVNVADGVGSCAQCIDLYAECTPSPSDEQGNCCGGTICISGFGTYYCM